MTMEIFCEYTENIPIRRMQIDAAQIIVLGIASPRIESGLISVLVRLKWNRWANRHLDATRSVI